MKHRYKIKTIRSIVAPIGAPYGFLKGGHFELTVYNFQVKDGPRPGWKPGERPSKQGKFEAAFLLKRYDNEAQFNKYIDSVRANASACIFPYQGDEDDLGLPDIDTHPPRSPDSAKDGILLVLDPELHHGKVNYTFKAGEEGLYFLSYQICPAKQSLLSSFEVEYHWYNHDIFGSKCYLPAGEMPLPRMFSFFAISYLICFAIWVVNLRMIRNGGAGLFSKDSQRPVIFAIHHLMSVLLFIKFLSVLSESIRYHFIRLNGDAELWSIIYYLINFVKGSFLFTVLLLIGSGWSMIKPFIQARERNVILFVLFLQVLNNIALIVTSREINGEKSFDRWTALFHLVDIICCCAVLLPIVWQVNALEKTVESENGDNEPEGFDDGFGEELTSTQRLYTLNKLRLFRSFYLVVVAYIYSTRVLVYLLAAALNYKYIWVRYFMVELVTLAFYVVSGMLFRPKGEQEYSAVAHDVVELIAQPESDKD